MAKDQDQGLWAIAAMFAAVLMFLAYMFTPIHAGPTRSALEDAADANVFIVSGGHGCSGTILTSGLILTADHCIRDFRLGNAKTITADGVPVKIVAYDSRHDLAILKFSDGRQQVAGLDFSTQVLRRGYPVYAVTNPSGELDTTGFAILAKTATGINWGNSINLVYDAPDMIQISSMGICHGSSGGALLDANGAIVGVIVASTVDDGCGQIVWAVPLHYVFELMERANAKA